MTSDSSRSPRLAASGNAPLGLTQRGRASVDALGSIQKAAASFLRDRARRNFEADARASALAAPKGSSREAVTRWVGEAKAVAESDPVYRLERFFQTYVASTMYEVGIPALEERRDQIALGAAYAPPAGVGSLDLDPDLAFPPYYDVEWHLRPGGWEGYDLYGSIGALVVQPIFRHGGFAAVPVGGDGRRYRIDVARQLPKPRYARLYEPGCGAGLMLFALHAVHPEAELIGSELAPVLLREARALAARTGVPLHLRQRDAAVDTREPDASVDGVVTFALHHELPYDANLSLLREMFRILKPGGDIVMSDPPPFRAVDPFHAALLDWDTDNRAEPYFSEAAATDWEAELQRIGFVDVASRALGPQAYPWVTVGSKPGV